MSRTKITKRNIAPDPVYSNLIAAKFINQMMEQGKKSVSRKILYKSFDVMKEKTKKDPLELFDLAIKNVRPLLEVRSKRVGGATYQVPKPVSIERGTALAIRWILKASRGKKGKPMAEKLADELISASNNEGSAVKKKQDTHKMAEANRAFAHFAW